MEGTGRMRERGEFKSWGLVARNARGGGNLTREAECRAPGLDIGGNCRIRPELGGGCLEDAGEGRVQELGGS